MSAMVAELVPMLVPMAWYSPFVSFGSAIMQPLYWVVSGLLVLFHTVWSPVFGANSGWTWTLAIVSLTVVIRTALIPLFVKQIKSSRNMQMLQPRVRELQKKYGHDREKLGQETMKLYKDSGTNPFASCMPLLLQSPIFIALFRVLDGASRTNPATGLPGIPRGHWLKVNPDLLTSLNGASIFGAKISDKFWPVGSASYQVIIVTVVLILAMTATLFITQLQLMRKNMPPEALEGPFAQQQKMMLYLFPLFFAFGGVNFPVGVLIYWFTSNLWTMAQQFYVIRRNPAPGTPAYAAWEARKLHHHKSTVGAEVAATNGSSANGTNGASNGHRPSAGTNGDQSGRQAPARQQSARQQPARQQPNRQQPRKQTRSQRRT